MAICQKTSFFQCELKTTSQTSGKRFDDAGRKWSFNGQTNTVTFFNKEQEKIDWVPHERTFIYLIHEFTPLLFEAGFLLVVHFIITYRKTNITIYDNDNDDDNMITERIKPD